MKIAVDLDGTAWKHKKFFSEFVHAMKDRGHTIGILTAHFSEIYAPRDLNLWREYGFPEPDFYIARDGEEEHEMLIGEWKRKMVRLHGIDVLFDDFGGNNPDIENTFFEDWIDCLVLKVIGDE